MTAPKKVGGTYFFCSFYCGRRLVFIPAGSSLTSPPGVRTMPWFEWLLRTRREGKVPHEDLFNLGQVLEAEKLGAKRYKEMGEVGKAKFATFNDIVNFTKPFEDGPDIVRVAAQALREGMAALLTQSVIRPGEDEETRLEALAFPFDGSTISQPSSANGLQTASSPKALTNVTTSTVSPS